MLLVGVLPWKHVVCINEYSYQNIFTQGSVSMETDLAPSDVIGLLNPVPNGL